MLLVLLCSERGSSFWNFFCEGLRFFAGFSPFSMILFMFFFGWWVLYVLFVCVCC